MEVFISLGQVPCWGAAGFRVLPFPTSALLSHFSLGSINFSSCLWVPKPFRHLKLCNVPFLAHFTTDNLIFINSTKYLSYSIDCFSCFIREINVNIPFRNMLYTFASYTSFSASASTPFYGFFLSPSLHTSFSGWLAAVTRSQCCTTDTLQHHR